MVFADGTIDGMNIKRVIEYKFYAKHRRNELELIRKQRWS